MSSPFLDLDHDELMSIMCAATVQRLLSHGFSRDEALGVTDKANDLLSVRVQTAFEKSYRDFGVFMLSGAEPEFMLNNTRAIFAMAGIDVADSINLSKIAERN